MYLIQGHDKGRAVTEEVLAACVEAGAELCDIVSVSDGGLEHGDRLEVTLCGLVDTELYQTTWSDIP
jgi:hypothetical protein